MTTNRLFCANHVRGVVLLILLSMSSWVFAGSDSHDNSYQDLKMGERLFKGMVHQDGVNCASCHNTQEIEELNWNPSALDIAIAYEGKDLDEFKSALYDELTDKSTEAHQGIKLKDEEIRQIQVYLHKISQEGLEENKPTINKLIFLLFLLGAIVIAIADLSITKIVPSKPVPLHGIVILVCVSWIFYTLGKDGISIGRQQYYEPHQPIKFSHKIHAGENNIDCMYCHHQADKSKSAGIPDAQLCMNCHAVIQEGPNSGAFEIKKISKALMDKDPVEWIKIHNLPDHVFFSHQQHVKVGKVACQECHGPVEDMDKLYQYNDLSMGWCLDCHRSKKVQFAENAYYKSYTKLHEDVKNGKLDSILVKHIGGQDCMKCHY